MTFPPALSLLTLTPLLGALVVVVAPVSGPRSLRRVALGWSLATLVETLLLVLRFNAASGELQFIERVPWIPTMDVEYFVGVDGLNLLLLLLAALITPFALAIGEVPSDRPRLYCALILLLEAGLFGNFVALNFIHWFLFWELSLIPAWFLILLWGGPGRRAAANQFFLVTVAGSVALLLAFQALFLASGTFDFLRLAELARNGTLNRGFAGALGWTGLDPAKLGSILFVAVFLGLAVKVPLLPFHTWLPDAYAEAPTGVTMLLTGALSKMGVYGFLRLLIPIFPAEARAHLGFLLIVTVASIVLPALIALAQADLKRILAYSSINHLAYCLLGLFALLDPVPAGASWTNERTAALNGAVLQMFNHGVNASLLFALVALLERRSGGRRGLDDFGGLRERAPVFAGLMGLALFASLGLPGLSGFIGEFLIFKGAFSLVPGAAVLAVPGLLLTSVFLLTLFQKMFTGPLNPSWISFPDLTVRERLILAPAILLLVLPGLFPQVLLRWINPAALAYVGRLGP